MAPYATAAGRLMPARFCVFYLSGFWLDSPSPGTNADGVQLVASCGGKHWPGSCRRRASWPNALQAYTLHVCGEAAGTRAARAKCEQKARGGATTAHRREGVGGDILLFYALHTSPGTTLHTRNFFQKSQNQGMD